MLSFAPACLPVHVSQLEKRTLCLQAMHWRVRLIYCTERCGGCAGDGRRPGSAGMMPVNSSSMGGMSMMGNGHDNQLIGNGPMGGGGMSMSNGPMGGGGVPPGPSMGPMHINSHQPNGMMPGSIGAGMGGGMPMEAVRMRSASMGMGNMPNGYIGNNGSGMMGNGSMSMHQMNMGGGNDGMLPSSSMPQGNSMQQGLLLQGPPQAFSPERQTVHSQ